MENELIPRFTFENFIVGDNNRFAMNAAQAVAKAPLSSGINPLFIYGNTGLGKSHLLHAICHYIRNNFSSLKVLYVSAETFSDDFENVGFR